MAYTKTVWVNDQSPDIDADNLNKMEQGIADAQFPEEGVSGQLLAKTIDGQEWVDAPNSAVWGLIAGDIEDQIDLNETFGKEKELTQAQYDALPSSKLTDDVAYYIKDGTDIPQASVISANGVQYDNTQSGLTADDVQDAIDELKSGLTAQTYSGTPSSGVSFGSRNVLKKFGNVYYFSMVITINSAISSGSTLFTVPVSVGTGYLMTSVDGGNAMVLTVSGNGVKTDFALTTGTVLRIGCSVVGN